MSDIYQETLSSVGISVGGKTLVELVGQSKGSLPLIFLILKFSQFRSAGSTMGSTGTIELSSVPYISA